ncbi:hypothetical protein [Marilutibacter spongiae]|uniref:Phage tail assembly protein n=1 Tax=Marilutibacter spongiae TaxID=2025720 RepID=A0A7W3TLS5_9GAMM|nr:hypothetical protein [Lysobacter spongiae]MBB1060429.1 hypothetical protein [Lysobacter spongiae]
MTIDLKALGAFTSDELVPQEVTIGDTTVTVHVRVLPSIDVDRFVEETRDPDREIRINSLPRVLAKAIRDEEGKAIFTADAARSLRPLVRKEFVRAFQAVNNPQKDGDSGND